MSLTLYQLGLYDSNLVSYYHRPVLSKKSAVSASHLVPEADEARICGATRMPSQNAETDLTFQEITWPKIKPFLSPWWLMGLAKTC